MGLLPSEFYGMTWGEFQLRCYHFFKREACEWDRTRTVMSYILNTSVSKKSDQRKPKQILPIPLLDKARRMEDNKMSDAEVKNLLNSMVKRDG